MCGIAGFFGAVSERSDAADLLVKMTSKLNHRGPDGTSTWLGRGAGLGHTRLAIIDLSTGDQPMWSSDGRNVIVFNGEIYNYRELRRSLEARGYLFKTKSDTEVIAAAVDAWGIDNALLKLRGMFAFALFDTQTRKLLLARDRVGIKPLYWLQTKGSLLFASEPKALLSSGYASMRVNPVAIHDYLAQGYAVTPATCWQDIQLLEPGAWLEVGADGVRQGRYWNWHPSEERDMNLSEATDRVESTFLGSLESHLISDVEVGAFLSGGLDSSLAVAMVSKELAPGIRTFCMGFDDPVHDESRYARQIAEYCGTSHEESHLGDRSADPDLLAQIIEQYDEPFGDSSCIPVFMVCKAMRQHVKVVLSGDGGDEVLGGYQRYVLARRLEILSRVPDFNAVASRLIGLVEQRTGRQGHRIAKAWKVSQLPRAAMLCSLHTYFSEEDRFQLYQNGFNELATAQGPTWSRFAELIPERVIDPAQQLIAAEMRLRLHADYLRKVDFASSAHGLEVRLPYLDNEMLDLATRIPMNCKIGNRGETKPVSRRLVKKHLPTETASRPKQGFTIPLDRWIGKPARDFLRDLLLARNSRIGEWFGDRALHNVWNAFDDARQPGGLSRFQRYQRVFLLASLELWLRRWNPSLG